MSVVEQGEHDKPGKAEPRPSEPRDPGRGIGTSLVASALGSVVGAIGYTIEELLRTGSPQTATQWFMVAIGLALVALVALTLAVPSGLLLGPVMLKLADRWIVRRPVATTAMFGITGLFAASLIHSLLDHGVKGPDEERWISMLFGATVGAAHPLLAFHRARRLKARMLLVAATASLLVGAVGRVSIDAIHNATARHEYAAGCHPSSATFALRPDLLHSVVPTLRNDEAVSRRSLTTEEGEWWPLRGNDALLHRYSALFVDGERTLAVNDLVLAPVTPWSRFGFPRTVEAHCLQTLAGAPAELARKVALVRSPPSELRPPRWF